jgi:methylase of polypeptide subunit release factors
MRFALLPPLSPGIMVRNEDPFLLLLRELKSRDYRFTCVTPSTHQRVLAMPLEDATSLQDIFGWNRSFYADELPPEIFRLLRRADTLEQSGDRLRSLVRVASIGNHLFLHSGFPTSERDAVFFGPDTYRFVSFIGRSLPTLSPPRWIVDMGAGSGAGGIAAAANVGPVRLTLVDINRAVAPVARANARLASIDAEVLLSSDVPIGCDLVIANPPYMMDSSHRTYRDGGDMLGGEIACRWTRQALAALAPGGSFLLYTGAAFVRGRAPLLEEIAFLCASADAELKVEEIDPDVFGEELDEPQYRSIERIAAVGISITTAL